MNQVDSIEIKLNSFILALVIVSPAITVSLLLGLGINSGGNLFVLLAITVVFLLKTILCKKISFRLNLSIAMLLVYICLYYGFSLVFFHTYMSLSFMQFLFYGLIPILCVTLKTNTKTVLTYCLYISPVTFLGGNRWFVYLYAYMNQAEMGYIYPIVTILICFIFHFRYYRKESSNVYIKACYVYNIYLLIRVLLVANRGAFLTIIVAIFISIIYDFNSYGTMKRMAYKQIILFGSLFIFSFIVVSNLNIVIEYVSDFMKNVFGYIPSFFLKMRRYSEDLSNGRNEILDIVLPAIKDNFLFGYGIETISKRTNGAILYPHNFILQFLYEGGILFSIIPIYYSIKLPIQVFIAKIKEKETYVFAALLVCQCYPKLLFSTDAWLNTALWMMIAFSIKISFSTRKEIKLI